MALDTQGRSFRVWNLTWPLMRRLTNTRDYGLGFPVEGTDEEIRWWWVNLYKTTRRAISQGVGGIPAVLLGVISVIALPLVPLVSLIQEASSPLWVRLALFIVLAAAVGYTLVLSACYAAYVSLRALPPQDFAKLLLGGRDISEVLQILAWEIRLTCEGCLDLMKPLADFNAQCVDQTKKAVTGHQSREALQWIHEDAKPLATNLVAFKAKLPQCLDQLDRVIAMKTVVAAMLGVAAARLCDHVVQYKPRIQKQILHKFGENWDYLMRISSRPLSTDAIERAVSLLNENERIVAKTRSRIAIVSDLFRFVDLHEFVEKLAFPLSSSEACLAYARGMSAIAARALVQDTIDIDDLERRFGFLYRKQRAHLSFEPHQACVHLCACVDKIRELSRSLDAACTDRGQQRSIPSVQEKILRAAPTFGLRKETGQGRMLEGQQQRTREKLLALSELSLTAELYFEWSRRRIRESFEAHLSTFPVEPSTAIVTCDYSKTVRTCLKSGLSDVTPRPMIFLLASGDADSLGPQYMRYELLDDKEYPNKVAMSCATNAAELLSRFERVIVLLGADVFSSDGDVLLSPETSLEIPRVLAMLRDLKVETHVIFAAGSYKCVEGSLLGEDDLFKYHFDYLALYSRAQGDYVIVSDIGDPIWVRHSGSQRQSSGADRGR